MNKNLEILKKSISKFEIKSVTYKLIDRFIRTINISLIIFLLIVILEIVLRSDSDVRKLEFYIILFFSIIWFFIQTIPILILKKELNKTANEIGKIDLNIKDELQNIIELDKLDSEISSKELIDAAIESFYQKTKLKDFSKLVSTKPIIKSLKYFVFIFVFLLVIQFNNETNKAIKSILFYNTKIFETKFAIWEISPGSVDVIKGDNVEIKINLSGIKSNNIVLNYKNNLQSEWKSKRILSDSNQIFKTQLKDLKYDTEYFLSTSNYKSDTNKLTVIEYPKVNSLKLKIIPPKYSRLSPIFQVDNGNIVALKGSKIEYLISSSKEITQAEIVTNNKSIEIETKINTASGEIIINQSGNYFIRLTDTSGHINQNPIEYSIEIKKDMYPEIKMIRPNKDLKLSVKNFVQFENKISDDYGFSKFKLNYKLSQSLFENISDEYKVVELIISKYDLEQTTYFLWNLDNLNLAAGDELSYYFSLEDNDYISGPKITRTKLLKITVPSIDEILTEADNVYADSFDELKEVLDETEKLKTEFEKLKNDLKKKDPKLNYTEKEKIKETLDKYEKLIEKAEKSSEKINDLKENLQNNNLLSEETLKKYEELQNLFKEIGSEELAKAFEDMNKLLDQMNRKNIQNKLDQIKFNEDQFQKSLERTLSLLKRLQVEQKLENVKNRIDDILREQNEIQRNSNNDRLEKLAEKQEQISQKTESLKEEAKELEELMKEIKNSPSEEMKKVNDKIKDQNNIAESENAKKELKQGDIKNANKHQQKINKNMETLQNDMNQVQNAMQKKNQLETLYSFMRIFNGLIELTNKQENLSSKITQLNDYSTEFAPLAQEENIINQNLSKLYKQVNTLSKKSFLVTPELGKSFGDTRRGIVNSINNLSEGKKTLSIKDSENIIASFNKSSIIIKKLIDMLLAGDNNGSGDSGMSLMQQLKKMGQQQMSLNQLTQKMLQGEKLSTEQMSQMQRLAQQQEMIRRSLEQLNNENKETGKSKTLTQNLDKILEDMKEVIKKINSSDFDEQIKQKQEKILSKLLDAQKSINDRDFEEKRESISGETIRRLSPNEINNLKNISDELKGELIKSLKEGYSKDYEDLIRRYFEELQKKKNRK